MMPYWVRIAIGAVLGLVAAVLLWLFVGVPWVTALAAAILAPLGFLATYFVWSADRLPEYEQVLFDRPNTLVSAGMLVAFALAGLGTGFLGGAGEAAPTPADELAAMQTEYQSISDAFADKSADAEATTAALNELRSAADPLYARIEALPDGDGKTALVDAWDYLTLAMTQLKTCAGGDEAKCVDARISASEVQGALARYAEAA